MTNETIVAIPPNVEEPDVLKQFLRLLVDRLDVVFGYRGGDAYATESSVTESVVTTVSESLQQLEEQLTASNADLLVQLSTLAEDLVIVNNAIQSGVFIKGWALKFVGVISNGPVTPLEDYNIATLERVSTGTYVATLGQTTILSENVIAQSLPACNGEDYTLHVTPGVGEFTIEVRDSSFSLTDPTTVVSCAGLMSKPGNLLPI